MPKLMRGCATKPFGPEVQALAAERWPVLVARMKELFADAEPLLLRYAFDIAMENEEARDLLLCPEAPRVVYHWLKRAEVGLEP